MHVTVSGVETTCGTGRRGHENPRGVAARFSTGAYNVTGSQVQVSNPYTYQFGECDASTGFCRMGNGWLYDPEARVCPSAASGVAQEVECGPEMALQAWQRIAPIQEFNNYMVNNDPLVIAVLLLIPLLTVSGTGHPRRAATAWVCRAPKAPTGRYTFGDCGRHPRYTFDMSGHGPQGVSSDEMCVPIPTLKRAPPATPSRANPATDAAVGSRCLDGARFEAAETRGGDGPRFRKGGEYTFDVRAAFTRRRTLSAASSPACERLESTRWPGGAQPRRMPPA